MSGWRVEVNVGGRVVGGQGILYVNPWERIGELNGVAVCTVSKIETKYLYTNLHFVFRAIYSFSLLVNICII